MVRAGLAKRLRFQSVPAHMHLLMYLIRKSPAMATSVLAFRDLAPHNTAAASARLRCAVAAACLRSASRAAAPLHIALAAAQNFANRGAPGVISTLKISRSQVSAFMASVMPPNIAQVCFVPACRQHTSFVGLGQKRTLLLFSVA